MCPPASMEAIIISSRARFPTTARSTSAITCLLSDETLAISVTIHSQEKNSQMVLKSGVFRDSPAPRVSEANDHFRFLIPGNLRPLQHRNPAASVDEPKSVPGLGNPRTIRADLFPDRSVSPGWVPNPFLPTEQTQSAAC